MKIILDKDIFDEINLHIEAVNALANAPGTADQASDLFIYLLKHV